MKKLLFILFIFFSFYTVSAQSSAQPSATDTLDFMKMENPPKFVGGMKAFSKYLNKNLKNPGTYQDQGTVLRVFVVFIVNKEGKITDVKVLKPTIPKYDAEAIKFIKNMPDWEPGKVNGQNVATRYQIPITFS